ncbi:ATP-grasp domain-containing protein [Blastochloris viridis]|uniref:Glycosyltransferase n=1 Tax=Blastochloris viridis TaxID=1079 RepID=A0A182D4L3_BLAVI|nr:ATP-grasp domain-containing protein [Blastochloris viridis]BAS00114.1 glycosyltransferase [Blastochloris viridis]
MLRPEHGSCSDTCPGVVILGGAHGTLALARSLGSRGVPVFYVSNDSPLPGWSRFVRRRFRWPGAASERAVDALLELARREGLAGALLVAGGDAEVRLVSRALPELSAAYRIMLPSWDALKWVCDKPFLYRRARELGLAIPQTYEIASLGHAEALELTFPVVLKPHMGGVGGAFVAAKVVRADDRAAFLAAYATAAGEIGGDNVVVQEMIPGGGESQFSYAALWRDGEPVAEFTARRARQYPVEFGFTSTLVEVVEEPQVVAAARGVLGSVRFSGLVEVEFKRDRRDGSLKLLDVNPRPWSWFGLAAAAGVDLGAMLWAAANGREAAAAVARPGTAWVFLVRDVVAAFQTIASGRLRVADYVASLARVRAEATFAVRDPVPALFDVPVTAWRVLARRVLPRLSTWFKKSPVPDVSSR